MGANIEVKNGYIYATANELVGTQINFDLISVTATENIIMAASLAKGITTINNAAQEPEVTDLIRCLNNLFLLSRSLNLLEAYCLQVFYNI